MRWLLSILISLMLVGCKTTQYIPVVEHRTDTTYIVKEHRDSLLQRDSIYIYANDTLRVEHHYHTIYKVQRLVDTIKVVKVDSIPYQVVVEKVVEKQSWLDKLGWLVGVAIIGAVAVITLGIIRKM